MRIYRYFNIILCRRMSSTPINFHNYENTTRNYEESIEALNSLQSNANYLKNVRSKINEKHVNSLVNMKKFIERSGIDVDSLNALSVIHVTGTKGKGSTCAYSESILREHGFKTGFFSSPHLISVLERIKIDGVPIGRDTFASYFWEIYNNLLKTRKDHGTMPIYFEMLALIAFKIFIREKVDVAIVEVGIGGEYDSTNILRNVPVAGITTIGIDHTTLLGNTIESIAWHKAGIMKNGSKVFTVSQKKEAMKILEERSVERQCSLQIVNNCDVDNLQDSIKMPHSIYKTNASLALTLAKTWMSLNDKNISYNLEYVQSGLFKCHWPGRFHILRRDPVNYYLDGAHTEDSLQYCIDWYKEHTSSSRGKRVLIFNNTGDRNTESHLKILQGCNFHRVYFVPNTPRSAKSPDFVNYNVPETEQIIKCSKNKNIWLELAQGKRQDEVIIVRQTISDALETLKDGEAYDVLVTGSLHLVGATLSLIDTNLQEQENVACINGNELRKSY